MRVVPYEKMRKLNSVTFVDKVGTVLHVSTDYALRNQPKLYTLIYCNGQQFVSRNEIEIARKLKV